jgi:hypothetical protein
MKNMKFMKNNDFFCSMLFICFMLKRSHTDKIFESR